MACNAARWIEIAQTEYDDCRAVDQWVRECEALAGPELIAEYCLYCQTEDHPLELDAWLISKGIENVPSLPQFDLDFLPKGDERIAYELWLKTYDGPKGDRFYVATKLPA